MDVPWACWFSSNWTYRLVPNLPNEGNSKIDEWNPLIPRGRVQLQKKSNGKTRITQDDPHFRLIWYIALITESDDAHDELDASYVITRISGGINRDFHRGMDPKVFTSEADSILWYIAINLDFPFLIRIPEQPKLLQILLTISYLGKQPVDQEMALCYNLEGCEFTHDFIAPSLDRQATCLSMTKFFWEPRSPRNRNSSKNW